MEKEIRAINIPAKVELRDDGTPGAIYGYPIVYNKDSEDMGFIERIAPGAAKNALKRSDIRALKNHDPNLIFGRQGVNLKFTEGKDGVKYEATPINTRTYNDVADEVRLGLLTGQSFGFTILSDKWEGLDTDKPKRTITEIGQIYDVGPVVYPAYNDTSVALRSMEQAKAKAEDKPAFTEPMVKVTFGDETKEFSLNDSGEINRWLDELRFGSQPTLPEPDSADGDPTITKPPDLDMMERINVTLNRYNKEE